MKNTSFKLAVLGFSFGCAGLFAQNNVYDWAQKYGMNGIDKLNSICEDVNGNTYAVGAFTNAITINGVQTSSKGSSDLFLIKSNPAGQALLGITIGGIGEDAANSVVYDNGFIYIGGFFSNTVAFDDASSNGNLTSDGGKDGFLLKLDTLGAFQWVKKWGGLSDQMITDLSANSIHQIIAVGNFEGNGLLHPDNSSTITNNIGGKDFFVSTLNPNGNLAWTRSFGSIGNDVVNGVATSSANEIVLTGSYSGDIIFDTTNVTPVSAIAAEDLFVLKLASTGHYIWDVTLNNSDAIIGHDVAVRNNEIALVGSFSGNISATIGGNHQSISSTGFLDMFFSKINSTTGALVWLKTAGSNSNEEALAVQFDALGDIYAAGYFASTINFGNSITLSSSGFYDAFAVKYTNAGNCEWAKRFSGTNNEQANDILVDDNFNVYVVGQFTGTVDFNPSIVSNTLTTDGSQDAFIVKLQKCVASTGVHTVIACDKYRWLDGVEYTSNNNTATFTLVDANHLGCDSIITLNLTIKESSTGIHTVTACQKYTWLNGITYTESNNTAKHILSGANINGCDSILTLNLTIKPLDRTFTYKVSTGTLIANQENATYQWINCNNNLPIAGATNREFTPTNSGEFALAVTYNGCADTSDCIVLQDVSVEENEALFSVFPNPSQGVFQITNSQNISAGTQIQVFSNDGKLLIQQNMMQGNAVVDLSAMPSGVYFLKLKSNDRVITKKLIKQ